MIPVRVFTHPVCATCPMAIRIASRLADENSDVELRIVSLGSARGREEAKEAEVLSVPTVFVGAVRFTGVPDWDELVVALDSQRNVMRET